MARGRLRVPGGLGGRLRFVVAPSELDQFLKGERSKDEDRQEERHDSPTDGQEEQIEFFEEENHGNEHGDRGVQTEPGLERVFRDRKGLTSRNPGEQREDDTNLNRRGNHAECRKIGEAADAQREDGNHDGQNDRDDRLDQYDPLDFGKNLPKPHVLPVEEFRFAVAVRVHCSQQFYSTREVMSATRPTPAPRATSTTAATWRYSRSRLACTNTTLVPILTMLSNRCCRPEIVIVS